MNNSDWDDVQAIFHAAMEVSEGERESYLRSIPNTDDDILAEVRSLLDAYDREPDLLEESVLGLGLAALNGELDQKLVGETIGTYQIIRKLGSGGMGDVYLADDQPLNRHVALKFLSAELQNDNWAKRQLKREAQAVAMLEHRNICQVYRFEEVGDHSFIVMQYVKGESLSTLIKQKKIVATDAFDIGRQVVDAIAAAHENGIIHRDIKPGNIMVSDSGEVKVLDFGLAKIIHDANSPSPGRDEITNATQKGLILGTVAYMSPEQLKGERLDLRTDIFSLGTLLYQLFTGKHPFERNSDAETISSVLSGKPSCDALSDNRNHVGLKRIVSKCLEHEKDHRYSSAVELLGEIDGLCDTKLPKRGRGLAMIAATVLLTIFVIMAGIFYFRDSRVYGVAVLPFANETADSSFDYLADGMAESMGEKLAATAGFRVIPYSRLSGLRAPPDLTGIGKEARADLVLTGRLYRDNGDLSVETKLVDTSDGQLLRTTSRTIDVTELQITESDLLEQMFSGLEIRSFTASANSDQLRRETKNNEAFRLNLVGRHLWRKRDPENLQKAITAFKQAIDIDPGYSRAHAGLADSYVLMSSVAYGSIPPKEAYSKARVAARQAIEIDPLNAEAHTSLGVILTRNDWNWSEAERCYRRAIEIDPDNGAAHFWFSGLLGITGRVSESIEAAERAKELDPFSAVVEYNLARMYYYARQYDRSLQILNRQNVVEQDDTKILYLKGLNYIQKDSLDEALTIFQNISGKNRMLGIAAMGYTLGKLGRRSEALQLIADLERDSKTAYVPPQEIAFIYIGLGEKDKAFQYLNRSLDERFGPLTSIKVEPLFDPIRDDVRFTDLLRKMALDAS